MASLASRCADRGAGETGQKEGVIAGRRGWRNLYFWDCLVRIGKRRVELGSLISFGS